LCPLDVLLNSKLLVEAMLEARQREMLIRVSFFGNGFNDLEEE
jgi:hypothetical protein